MTFHDLTKLRPVRTSGGWQSKTIALLDVPWRRVLFLDADAYLVADPANLLEQVSPARPFAFWEDLPSHDNAPRWAMAGLTGHNGIPSVQGGQLVIDRLAFWRTMVLAHWMNQHSDYWYVAGYGDQDQWRFALAASRQPFLSLGRADWESLRFRVPRR